jgi:DNA-binding response OmpR family regulator
MTDPINKRKPKILISEDDYENKIFLEVLLKQYFEVYICDSAESFYYYLNEGPIDVILMDISIYGDKNGLQLTREIKSSPLYKQIPVILLMRDSKTGLMLLMPVVIFIWQNR